MLVSHRNNFIYTKTVKTAGTSVESYYEPYCMPEGKWTFSPCREPHVSDAGVIGYRGSESGGKEWFNHMPAADIRNKGGDDIWNEYFKFCVIRNPFDKLVSYFFFLERQRSTAPKEAGKRVERFREWIAKGVSAIDRDKYLIDGEICVDYFIRFEDLEQGIKQVCDRVNVPFEPERLPKLKAGLRDSSIPLSAFYDEKTTLLVAQAYQFELDMFGYTLPT